MIHALKKINMTNLTALIATMMPKIKISKRSKKTTISLKRRSKMIKSPKSF